MRHTLSIHPLAKAVLLALGTWGTFQLLQTRGRRQSTSIRRDAVQRWEDEGGAVPVGDHRIAAAVSASPGDDLRGP